MTGCTHDPGGHDGTRPMYGTAAARARAWLLVEHPGPWPASYGEMTMPPALDAAVTWAEALDIRVQLIRRPGRRRTPPPIQVYAGWTADPEVWIEGQALSDHGEVARLDLDRLAVGRSPGLGPCLDGPLLLVCTHGRRSACCARLGRPLATGLAERFPEEVWETTHVGGHEFAANLVCLPHGLYYGGVTPDAGARTAAAYLRGEVLLGTYRGRAGLPGPLQAAEYFVRARTGCGGIDEVVVEASATSDVTTEVLVSAAGQRYRVVVVEAAADRTQTGLPCPTGGARYRLLDLTPTATVMG